MKKYFSLAVWVLPIGFLLVQAEASILMREENPDFPLKIERLKDGQVQVYAKFVKVDDSNTAQRIIRGINLLDSEGIKEKYQKEIDNYVVGRTALVIKKPVTYFSESRLLAEAYMNAILPNMRITKHSGKPGYRAQSLVPNKMPSTDKLEVAVISHEQFKLRGLMKDDTEPTQKLTPEICLLQQSSEYGPLDIVTSPKPIYGIIAIVCHYGLSANETLILTENIGYLKIPRLIRGLLERAFRNDSEAAAEVILKKLNDQ